MSDLKDALTEIDGIGDARADEILAVIADHDTPSDVEAHLRDAVDAHDAGQHSYAAKHTRAALDAL